VHATTIDDAADFGEVVLLAVPWRAPEALPSPQRVRGKIVIDAMNPYTPDFSLIDLGDDTSSEIVRRRLPGARPPRAPGPPQVRPGGSAPRARRRAAGAAPGDGR
jgi:predicted dinucleotide-binding enzyme